MKSEGTPASGRKKATAPGKAKTSVNARPEKTAAPKPAAVKNTGRALSAAKPALQKPAKVVTSKTKKNPVVKAALKAAESVKKAVTKAVSKSGAKAVTKKAAETLTETLKKVAAPAKTQAKAKPEAKSKTEAKAKARPVAPAKASKKATENSKAPVKTKTPTKPLAKPVAAKSVAAPKPATPAKPSTKTAATKSSTRSAPAKSHDKAAPATATPKTSRPKAPSRTLRPKRFTELETARGFGFPEGTPELPDSYGEDTLVLMTKDPETLFAYWDITPERLAQAERAKQGGAEYREALRLAWTSADLLEDSFALVPVSLLARRWYLRVPFSGRSYSIEIGWLGEQGHFISLLGASNASDAPESWARTRERLQGAAAAVEYSLRDAQPLGASENAPRAATAEKRASLEWNYEGPGSLSSSDAARKPVASEKTRA